jgi:hypothetical protein
MEGEAKIEGVDHLIEQIQRGSMASGSKEWLDDYIWTNVVRKIVQFTNCAADFGELMRYRSEIKALLMMGQDLRRDVFQAKDAAARLKKAYDDRMQQEPR